MTVKQVIHKVRRDYNLFCNSGGGMTISGGACEMQPEFTINLLKAAHDEGIRTAVEMEGAFPWETVRAIAEHCDFIMYDLKHMDKEKHIMGTKVSNERILDNAKRLVKMGKKLQFRTPLIPGFNDSLESVAAIAHFIRNELGLSPAEYHELLGYNNEYGLVVENSQEGIYKGLKKLLQDKELLEYYKKKAAEMGSFFSKEKTVAAVEKMLDEI